MKKKFCVLVLAISACVFLSGIGSATPRSGGTFVFCAPYGGDVFSLDMHRTGNIQDFIVGLNIHRSLYKWDPSQNKPVLDLAESVEESGDGLIYTYKLRKNVKFHNGRQMTADDIIYSYNRIMNPKTAASAAVFVKAIKGSTDVQAGKADSIAGLKK